MQTIIPRSSRHCFYISFIHTMPTAIMQIMSRHTQNRNMHPNIYILIMQLYKSIKATCIHLSTNRSTCFVSTTPRTFADMLIVHYIIKSVNCSNTNILKITIILILLMLLLQPHIFFLVVHHTI